jgi:hypothetical protein
VYPEGKYITGVNVSVTPNVPIYTDYPVSLDKKVGFAEQDIIALYDAINVIMTDVIPSLMV